MRRAPLLLAVLMLLWSLPRPALAHDDPVVTVRIMCNGFNVLDMDAVLGELADSARLNVDGTVSGSGQIEAWVKDQMDHDLRIQIVDMGVPEKLADGYRLSWTARFSRQDWRQAGITVREASNTVVIHNGRITSWDSGLSSRSGAPAPGAADESASPVLVAYPSSVASSGSIPELFGVPLSLLAAGLVAIAGLGLAARAMRR